MSRTTLFIISPALTGLLLLTVSQIDLALLKSGVLDVHTILSWEIALVLVCLALGIAGLFFSVLSAFKRRWLNALLSLFSVFAMLALYTLAGIYGAAFLNAT